MSTSFAICHIHGRMACPLCEPVPTRPTTPGADTARPLIWVLHCPFRKTGSPVVGSFGATIRGVVIIPVETWTALCRQHPALAATQFEVGSYD